jgi:homoserine kinase type II
LLEKQISELIETFYDIGKVSLVYEIFGGFTNRGFGIRTYKDHDSRTYFVRKYKDGVSIEDIQFEHALIHHAIKNGLTVCAGVVPARNNETLIQPTNGDGVFAVFENLSGEDKYTWCDTELTDTEYRSAAGVLAEFHNAVHDFDPGRFKREEPPIATLLPIIARNFIQLGQKMNPGKFQSYFKTNLNAVLGIIEGSPLGPREIEGLPVIPTHYDFHPGNLKWDCEKVKGLFDFDWSKMDLRLFDVCMAIVYFCSQWGGNRDGKLLLDKVTLFLGSYQHRLQNREGLGPLRDEERRVLPKMLAMANIYLVHWEVLHFYDNKEVNENEYLGYLKHNIRLGRWLDTHGSAITDTVHNVG